MVSLFVKKNSETHKGLKELKKKDEEHSKIFSEVICGFFGDEWSVSCDYKGLPTVIHSELKPDGWVKGDKGYQPTTPIDIWNKPFPWNNDNISKIVCGEKIFIFLDKQTLVRGFKVNFHSGNKITLECDRRLLKYVKLSKDVKIDNSILPR